MLFKRPIGTDPRTGFMPPYFNFSKKESELERKYEEFLKMYSK